MKLPIAFLLLALPLVAQGDARWVHDLDSALRRAQGERKQVFVDVWTEWCGPCQYLQKSIFPTSEASAALATLAPFSSLRRRACGSGELVDQAESNAPHALTSRL